ncbi:hybrid sensor histidine kinase/response regulator [Hyunsoonleella pacifica]|uniref:histidine kinase n=2 Tax=Hyunsoonleella pacifica TaxID=1080224 RepID=A0A4Q9FS27_9FLAO|nr:hybrid sensor histidine kinase/response regulator [Hyunsoonleella pacifica]GGD18662.1 hybrid sensor histidine kinase/response regulator [Hyunsoonleella pacifica]
MSMLKHILITLFVAIVFSNLSGQEMNFYHYGLDDGISQTTIRSILKDSNGFLWIGTQEGLNRFDGTTFKIYKSEKNNASSISGNYINALIEDDHGNIWIGTNNNGISIYNPNINSFKTTSINKGKCNSLSKTASGMIIATILNEGIVIFDKNGTIHKSEKIIRPNKKSQYSASFANGNDVCIGTLDGRLFTAEIALNHKPTFKEIDLGKALGSITTLFVKNHTIFIGTTNGLFVFNTIENKLSKIVLEKEIQLNENLNISSIDAYNSTFYIGTFNGLFIAKGFNEEIGKFKDVVVYKAKQKNTNSITSDRVHDTFTDGKMLWVGTHNLDVTTSTEPVFKTINTTSNITLNNAFILSFAKNRDFTFVGTRKGINCIDSNQNTTYITKENTNNALAFNVIRGMAIDPENYLWVATLKGLSIIDLNNFNPRQPKIISLFNNIQDNTSLSNDATRGVYVDHKGSIWIMTYGGGVNRFTGNIKAKSFTFDHYKVDANSNSISSNFTYNMSQDSDLNYWITSENGLNKLQFEDINYRKPKFTNYFNIDNDSTSLSNNTTLHTWHDADKTLWVATQEGFNKFNTTSQTFKRYEKAQGLTNTVVYSITEDVDRNLWLTTNGGLFKFNKLTEEFTNYNQHDGIQGTEFNLGGHLYDKETNKIYVGGVKGFNIFNPKRVSELDVPGNLTFTSLRIKDEEINALSYPEITKESITKTKEIVLNHDDFPCYINFSDLDLRPNKNNQFIYALNDNQWNELRNSKELQILSLPIGLNQLKIQGKSRNKIWNKPPLELLIKVIPPWYQNNIAYAFYILTFLVLAYIFYRLSLQRQIARQESKRLQELDTLKSRFITNITHEFRTPLTIINGYVDNLKEGFSSKEGIKTSLETIEQNSNNLLDLVNQMLNLAKLEKKQLNTNLIQNDIVTYTNHIVDSFLNIASDKLITLKFNSKPDKIIIDYDAEKWRQILTNLISNALKFSPQQSELTINLEKLNNKTLRLEVIDQGYGISEEALPFIFDRFYQVENADQKVSQGTGIGLALTKELVELFKGKIEVQSKLGQGSTFTITLPITNNEELKDPFVNNKKTTIVPVVPQIDDVVTEEDANSVLIVEDNTDMARYITSCLKPDYKVTVAKDGKQGLELATKQIPDIVITDVMMPIMDGFELTQKLQSNNNTNHIPIIVLTSKAMQEDKLEGITSGADAYLTKPFQKEELRLRMQMLIAKRKKLQERYTVTKIVESSCENNQPTDKNLIFLNTTLDAIHLHIEDPNFGAKELAKYMAMSDSQLYRKLKAITNTSTAIFIRKVRLEKAKKLLKSTELSVSEIAYSTGFNNPNWFSKAFKEEFNDSPSNFRN